MAVVSRPGLYRAIAAITGARKGHYCYTCGTRRNTPAYGCPFIPKAANARLARKARIRLTRVRGGYGW